MAKLKFPKTLGACVDRAYTLREARIAKQREFDSIIEGLKADEVAMEEHIIATFNKTDIEGAKGTLCTASVTRLTVPSVKDWDLVHKYVMAHDAWDLIEKRMARVAYRDRLEAGEEIPGVESFVKVGLSLTKINGKPNTKEK